MTSSGDKVVVARNLRKAFRRETGETVQALDGVSFEARRGTLTALVGPDGAGKTTLIRLAAGLVLPDSGDLQIVGLDVAAVPQEVQNRIGYMPQRFGLYEDLSVQENLDLYADLHGLSAAERRERYDELLTMTGLTAFRTRLAGRLSGGMKQKLGLACTLVRTPDLLLLDEPTVGVDPLSRRDLWQIIVRLVREHGHTVLLSTSYLDEAERCDHALVLHGGKILGQGAPAEIAATANGRTFLAEHAPAESTRRLQARLLDEPQIIHVVPQGGRVRFLCTSQPTSIAAEPAFGAGAAIPVAARFEDGFMALLASEAQAHRKASSAVDRRQNRARSNDVAVEVRDLVRTFGAFTAVDRVGFNVRRGEIFGLLGPNGAGKTTTFRMLCGLLPATSGILRVAGADLRTARADARQRIGYVAQKFSLYGQLSVHENLDFFARTYGLRGSHKRRQIDQMLEEFELSAFAHLPSAQLPGGYKQRLAMAAALLHDPDILFLDEATSGADPVARREFWGRINALAATGVAVVVTTHAMEEAEYCDRAAILDGGRLIAEGTPTEIREQASGAQSDEITIEDAFVAIVEKARRGRAEEPGPRRA